MIRDKNMKFIKSMHFLIISILFLNLFFLSGNIYPQEFRTDALYLDKINKAKIKLNEHKKRLAEIETRKNLSEFNKYKKRLKKLQKETIKRMEKSYDFRFSSEEDRVKNWNNFIDARSKLRERYQYSEKKETLKQRGTNVVQSHLNFIKKQREVYRKSSIRATSGKITEVSKKQKEIEKEYWKRIRKDKEKAKSAKNKEMSSNMTKGMSNNEIYNDFLDKKKSISRRVNSRHGTTVSHPKFKSQIYSDFLEQRQKLADRNQQPVINRKKQSNFQQSKKDSYSEFLLNQKKLNESLSQPQISTTIRANKRKNKMDEYAAYLKEQEKLKSQVSDYKTVKSNTPVPSQHQRDVYTEFLNERKELTDRNQNPKINPSIDKYKQERTESHARFIKKRQNIVKRLNPQNPQIQSKQINISEEYQKYLQKVRELHEKAQKNK